MFERWKRWWHGTELSEAEFEKQRADLVAAAPIPTFWLLGKTGSGKSSIIRYLTGVEKVEIGSGYRPQTQTSHRYDFPDAIDPLVTFLDTRGLGEASYDPTEDLAAFSESSQLIILTVRVMDHALDELVSSLRTIRKAAPERPVLLALTCLHEAYPGEDHPQPDPFGAEGVAADSTLPEGLVRSLAAQRERFAELADVIVPIDLTRLEEGFDEPDFGGPRLKQATLKLMPQAYRQTLLQMEDLIGSQKSLLQKRSRATILAASTLSATAAAVPLPWVDIPVVLGIQTHLAYRIAGIYGQELTASRWAQMTGAAGGRIALRMAVRELLKVIPWLGMAANAAAAFAYTYATGMAWDWYFAEVRKGYVPRSEQMQDVFQEQLARGATLWQTSEEQAGAE